MKKLALLWLTGVVLLGGINGVACAGSRGHGFHGGHGFRHGHHGHGGAHFGFFFGAPLFWDPYPYYYPYRPPVYIERQPQTYIQQSSNYWYYCRNPSGYYPYVQNCPMGWMQVVPQTPPQ